MKIYLSDLNRILIYSWKQAFKDYDFVSVRSGSIFTLKADAIISPANSFGFMDGGIDYQLSKFLGWHVQERLQDCIEDKYDGELLVGQAELIETDNKQFPYLISAPTMRVPIVINQSVNVYLAMKAVLRVALENNLNSIAVPGMGTGVGRMPPNICAKQMKQAIDEIILNKRVRYKTWEESQIKHQLLYTSQTRDLQF